MPSGGHRRDDNRTRVVVQFIWRHDKTWPCLTNFATPSRIELHQVNITSGWHGRFLSPFPIFLVEPGRSGGIKETVFTSLMHLTSGGSPSRTRPASPANNNPTWLSVKFNFISELSLFQKHLGDFLDEKGVDKIESSPMSYVKVTPMPSHRICSANNTAMSVIWSTW
jgi:hypothetical protein